MVNSIETHPPLPVTPSAIAGWWAFDAPSPGPGV